MQQPKHFSLRVSEQIGDVICDAGVLVWSFYQNNAQEEFGLQDLLETIKKILVEDDEEHPQTPPTVKFPMTDPLGFVDFVVETLMDPPSCLIDSLGVGDFPLSLFASIIESIQNIKADGLGVFRGNKQEITAKEVISTSSHQASPQRPPSTSEVVGLDYETGLIKDRLMGGSKKLQIVAIVGMPGLGKSTLAAKVYNDSSVSHHFHVRAWSPISQMLDKKKVLIELLQQVDPYRYPDMSEHDLANRLRRRLKRRRYLIFLDEVWETEAWNHLKESFPNDDVGSRLIITSRHHDAAPHHMLDSEPYVLNHLNEERAWKDQEVSVRKLLCLWMAEGFIQKSKIKNLADVAEDYLKDLIARSLIMIGTKRFVDGGVKACRIHDLLHDFCLQKAKDEFFVHLPKGCHELSAFNEPPNLRRLCIHSKPKHLKQAKLFCPHAVGIPSNERGQFSRIPSSIAKLCNLESLIVDSRSHEPLLPNSVWNLQKLKYLHIRNYGGSCGIFSLEPLEGLSILYELDRLSGALFTYGDNMERILRNFPNARRLKFQVSENPSTLDFNWPENVKKLTLSGFSLTWRNISTIGEMPTLEVQKLLQMSIEGNAWEIKEGEFSKLRILKMVSGDLVKWTADDDLYLQKLVLHWCNHLEKMPSCLECIHTLEMIEVLRSSETAVNLVRQIEEEQKTNWGNSNLKIIINQ
ncbi:OLC1v1036888C1 [Oldenlandia corymbosa var. corymbosa]|uniref:OLC1v1036888C1 n=1 Tax=Oldenlandia corymbosa var. corymbosa TaxID=529605 RepID=A0AAV1CZ28_OLDCO|nr:OLC1v1036888C1 [Oldenlandia corymbosa var. corymbosa]